MGDYGYTYPPGFGDGGRDLRRDYLAAASIYWVVTRLAVGERARAFKSVTPGLLPPLAFSGCSSLLSQRRCGAMSSGPTPQSTARGQRRCAAVVLLSRAFPGGKPGRLRDLVQQQIRTAVTEEWPRHGPSASHADRWCRRRRRSSAGHLQPEHRGPGRWLPNGDRVCCVAERAGRAPATHP